jgi:predicted unusual protein kinase regulating ubiquinone biosynthesis (AarF/ABC1/UbiB family)
MSQLHSNKGKTDIKHGEYRSRYRRTLRFFARLVISLIWWELIARRVLGSHLVGKGRPKRFQNYARDFRALAVEMGGVMIKLGQFFSARVDILPIEITGELAGLQDEVPPVPFESIRSTILEEIGPIENTFSYFDEEPLAAASLGQVYLGRLKNGDQVVLKAQRPGIADLVTTDLAALDVVGGWAMRFKAVRRRADVPSLLAEFAQTLWEELDYVAEAENARRFAEMFADDDEVRVPAVYTELSTVRVLILEDVTAIKIADHQAIEAIGIDRHEVAMRLFGTYMSQIFEHRFFHADPHPGNLFIEPMPVAEGSSQSRPFRLVFVDFGMVGKITDNVLAGMREGLLAVGTRDMRRLVKAYQILGVLLPDADLDRLAEAEQQLFDRVWGMNMRQMLNVSYKEMRQFATDFSDLVYEMPFQIPQDMIYVGRAFGILSGMCAQLHPEFNPWDALAPYAKKLMEEELRFSFDTIADQLSRWLRLILDLPRLMEEAVRRFDRGELWTTKSTETAGIPGNQPRETGFHQISLAIVFAALTGSSTVLLLNAERLYGLIGFSLAGVSLLVLLWRTLK